jgi:branched-chain amino acid transport system substrate-binding protein
MMLRRNTRGIREIDPRRSERCEILKTMHVFARIALLFALFLIGFCARGATSVIRIAGAAPLSGDQAASNVSIRNGMLLAVEEAQARFARLGVKLEYLEADDGASEETGVRVAERLAADRAVLGVVGHVNSSVSLKAMRVYAKTNLLMVSAASTNPGITTQGLKNVARVCGRDDVQGPIAAQFVRDVLGARRVFIVNEGTEYGIGLANSFRDRARRLGLSVVGFVTNPDTSLTGAKPLEAAFWTNLAQQVKLYQPQAVYYGGVDPQGAALTKALREAGFQGSIVAPDGIDTQNFVTLAGANAKGVYYTSTAGPLSYLTNASEFAKRYAARFKMPPESYSAYAYDAANVVVDAVIRAYKNTGNNLPTRAAVSEAARAASLNGITGPIGFTDTGDRRVADYFVLQFKTAKYPGTVVRKLSSAPPTP